MKIIRQVRLEFRQGTADKVYEVDLCEVGPERFVVNFRYGRRDATLREGSKTALPVDLVEAERVFDKLALEKRRKGYSDARPGGDIAPGAPVAEAELSPGEQRILRLLQSPLRDRGWDPDRVIWRAGVLRLRQAVPLLAPLLTTAQGERLYSLLWTMARCGEVAVFPAIRAIANDEAQPPRIRRVALEGMRALTPDSAAFADEQLQKLPASLYKASRSSTAQGFEVLLHTTLASSSADWSHLHTLYLADTPLVRPALLAELRTAPLDAPSFRALRYIFKAAELRDDAEVFGILARRMEVTRANFSNRWGRTVWTGKHGRLDARKELARDDSRLAWGAGTKRYFKGRIWRTLRGLGSAGSASYPPMAAAYLLRFSDGDAQPARQAGFWDWRERRQVVYAHRGPFGENWALNWILFGGPNSRMEPRRDRTFWFKYGKTPDDGIPAVREELFPELWDAAPQELVRLLRESHCAPVQLFASRAFRAAPESWRLLRNEDLLRLLNCGYEPTARLAADVAIGRYDAANPDLDLVLALANGAYEAGRSASHAWVRENPSLFAKSAEFIVPLALSAHEDSRSIARELLQSSTFDPERAQGILGALLDAVAEFGEDAVRCRAVCDLIVAAFAQELRTLALERVAVLIESSFEGVAELGVRILVAHDIRPADLPDALLAQAMTSPHPGVRPLGVRLFGELSDAILIDRYAVLLHLITSEHTDVRAAARPIVARLVAGHAVFANSIFAGILDVLSRPEGAEGVHQSLVVLLRETLGAHLGAADARAVLQLLLSPSPDAQEAGGVLLGGVSPAELQIPEIVRLANHDVKSVRLAAARMMERDLDRVRAQAGAAIRLLDADWEDVRTFAVRFFETHLGAENLGPDLLVDICDSVRLDVQAFGRRMIGRAFEEEAGSLYLTKLSQHPSVDMQLFASQALEQHAGGDPGRLRDLCPYFQRVLSGVNRGRIAKARVFAFLAAEARRDEESAEIIAGVMDGVAASIEIGARALALEVLVDIQRRWPNVEVNLTMRSPERRGVHAV